MVSSESRAQHRDGYDPSDDYPDELHFSPDLAPMELSIDEHPGQGSDPRWNGSSGYRPSVGRQMLRGVVYGLIITTIAGAAFASQYGDDRTKGILRALRNSVGELSSVFGAKSSSGATETVSKNSDQISTGNKAPPPEALLTQSIPAAVAAGGLSPDSQRRLETMASDLALLRRAVEQLATRQQQMIQDIATMQAADQNVSQRLWLSQQLWWPSQSTAVRAPSRKTGQKIAPSAAPVHSSAGPVPTAHRQEPAPLH